MIFSRMPKTFLLASLVIPIQSENGWKVEHFSRIPSNEVSFSKQGILVRVKQSASPLIYPLSSPVKINGFKVSGEFRGVPHLSDVAKQGKKGADDYPLRVGLIVPGKKRLTGLKKTFASQWVKHLYSQVPEGSGLDHIHFFNVTQNPAQVGQQREHPNSNLIQEQFFAAVEKAGPFVYEYTLKEPIEAVAVWISIDGDDTKSEFEVVISNLELLTDKNPL